MQMRTLKLIILSILFLNPMLMLAQENPLKGKWQFNVPLIKQECSSWITTQSAQLTTLEGDKKIALKKEVDLVKQIESSLNFSFSGMVYNFANDSVLNVFSTKGGVGSQLNYTLNGNQLHLTYPKIKEPVIYRYELKEGRLYIYEIVNEIERFAQVLDKI